MKLLICWTLLFIGANGFEGFLNRSQTTHGRDKGLTGHDDGE